MGILLAVALIFLSTAAFAAPMREMTGLKADEGCLEPAYVATGKLRTCPVGGDRTRIWCPNGKVFERDNGHISVPLLRSICEMNQLPG